MLKLYLQLLQKSRSSAGWTLAELMIATALTLVVVMAAGFGLVTILRENKVASATGEMQYDMNRAVEFLSDEIRSASVIETNATDIEIYALEFDAQHSDKTPILALKVPGVPQRVVYFVEEVDDSSIWRGPAVIRRFGPDFKKTGEYSNNKDDTSTWQTRTLIDMIDEIPDDQKQCDITPKDNDPATNVEDDGTKYIVTDQNNDKWHRLPADESDVKGFFVCVREDKQLAKLHLYGTTLYLDDSGNEKGQLRNLASTDENARFGSQTNYEITTQTFARSESVGGNGEGFFSFYIDPVTNKLIPDDPSGGKIKTSVIDLNPICPDGTSPSDVTTSMTQGTTDPPPTLTSVSGTSSSSPTTVANTDPVEIVVEANCGGTPITIESSKQSPSDGPHVKVASNDSRYLQLDEIVTDPSTVTATLSSKGLLQGDSNTIQLADNEILLFFELSFDDPSDVHYNDAIVLLELSE